MAWTAECRKKYKQSREWHSAYMRQWNKDNPEKLRASQRKSDERRREKRREHYHLVGKFKKQVRDTATQEKVNARVRELYKINPEKHAEYQRRWKEKNPDRVHAMRKRQKLKAKYGITLEKFDEMYSAQKGKCANNGCNISGPSRGKGCLVVDHCHKTGRVRGLLCIGCNFALGSLNDSTKRAIGLATYLRSGKFNAI
jgi:hypothetical protein